MLLFVVVVLSAIVFITVPTDFIALLVLAIALVNTEFIAVGIEADILLRAGKDENGMAAARSGVPVWNLHPRVGCREDSYN